jgi:signal transduction histidine kinase
MEAERDPTIRAIAGVRRAAILRGRGEQDAAREVGRRALDAMDESAKSTAREALLLRFLDEPANESTIEALARLLAGPDDAVARAMLSATEAGRAAIGRREAALAARARFEAARLRPERGGAVATRLESRLMIATGDGDGAVLGFEFDLPGVEPGHRLVSADEPAPHDRLVARAPVGALLAGSSIEASCPLAELDAAFTLRGAWIGALLLAVVAAIGGALWVWSRAAARERALAKARSDFVARVGHDLRTPLSLIRMYAETIATGRVEDRAQTLEFAGIVTRESERLSKLVGTVLDFARVGENAAARRELELSEWTREVVASLRPLLDRAGFAVEVDVAPVTAPVDADALRGALCNLIENALAHADSGKAVAVRCRREGDFALLEVEDRGPGVQEDELGRLFDRFVRGRAASGKGVGLGLALVRDVALAHGGSVEAGLRDGGGLRFTIALPVAAAPANGRRTT